MAHFLFHQKAVMSHMRSCGTECPFPEAHSVLVLLWLYICIHVERCTTEQIGSERREGGRDVVEMLSCNLSCKD